MLQGLLAVALGNGLLGQHAVGHLPGVDVGIALQQYIVIVYS